MGESVLEYKLELERRAELFLKTERDLLIPASAQQEGEVRVGDAWIPQRVNFDELQGFHDPYHTAALQAKVRCCIGLGLVEGPKEDALPGNPHESFADIMGEVGLDTFTLGNGYAEVVRSADGKPRGMYWLPGAATEIHQSRVLYRQVSKDLGAVRASYFRLFGVDEPPDGLQPSSWGGGEWKDLHEVIHFRLPSTWSTFYGGPDWLGCLKSVMLADAARTWNADFFDNGLKIGGVVGIAKKLQSRKELESGWTEEERRTRASWKSEEEVVNDFFNRTKKVGSKDSRAWLVISGLGGQQGGSAEKAISFTPLAQAPKDADFVKLLQECRDETVTTHAVPQLLLSIATPGKLGGSSDAVGQLLIFEAMRMAPTRLIFESQLNRTIGKELGGQFKFRGIDSELIDALRAAAGAASPQVAPGKPEEEPSLEAAVKRVEKGMAAGEI